MENKIYNEEDLIPTILRSIPGFNKRWEEYLDYWGEDRMPIGIDIGEFSDYTRELLRENADDELRKIFNLVEEFLSYGNEKVKSYVYFEFIENLSNEYDGYTEEELRSYMGPKSLKALDRINAFWMEGKIIESLD